MNTTIRDQLVETLDQYRDVKLAILYGSVAAGRERADSDVDLGVATHWRTRLDENTLIDISLACSRATGREVQVRDLSRADGLFLREVLTKGAILKQLDPAIRGELIIRMLDFVEDMLPNIRMMRAAQKERFLGRQ